MKEYPVRPDEGASATNPFDWLASQYPTPYGKVLTVSDSEYGDREFVYCYWNASAPAACALGSFCFIGTTGQTTAANNPAIAAVATSATVRQRAGIICNTLTAAGGVWVQTKGRNNYSNWEGTTDIALGDQLQLSNTQIYAVQDGGTARTVDSIGVALEAYTTNAASGATQSIYLHGDPINVGGT